MNFPSPNQQQEKIFLRSQQTNSNSHSHSESGTRGREKKKARISIDSGFDEREEGGGGGGENKENESGVGLGREIVGDEGQGEGMNVEEIPESENGDYVGERITQAGSTGTGMGERRSGIGDPPVIVENWGVDEAVRFLTFLRNALERNKADFDEGASNVQEIERVESDLLAFTNRRISVLQGFVEIAESGGGRSKNGSDENELRHTQ